MKFHLAINLERNSPDTAMTDVRDHVEDMIRMADQAGFEIAWAAEHHALEMTIAPNPFQILTWWSSITETMRLGCGVANTAYWHRSTSPGKPRCWTSYRAAGSNWVWARAPTSASLTG